MSTSQCSDLLKEVYSCIQLDGLMASPYRRRQKARQGRRFCEARLQAARLRREKWAVDVHKSHLQLFDIDILGGK